MSMQIVPYLDGSQQPLAMLRPPLVELEPGEYAGIHIFIDAHNLQRVLSLFESWFGHRDEIILCASGLSEKTGLGYVVLEWEHCQPDELFLTILTTEATFVDYCRYIRR